MGSSVTTDDSNGGGGGGVGIVSRPVLKEGAGGISSVSLVVASGVLLSESFSSTTLCLGKIEAVLLDLDKSGSEDVEMGRSGVILSGFLPDHFHSSPTTIGAATCSI
jgi:hypothetical protein